MKEGRGERGRRESIEELAGQEQVTITIGVASLRNRKHKND